MNDKEFFLEAFSEANEPQKDEQTQSPEVKQPEVDEPKADEKPDAIAQETPNVVEQMAEPSAPETDVQPDKFVIDGVEVTIDEIRQWKQGNMRQADYTRKTQELAEMRKQLGKEEFSDDSANPDAKPVKEELSEIQALSAKVRAMELNEEISKLKSKYKDFDDVAVLNKANELGLVDLEEAYKLTKPAIDVEAIKAQALEDAKAQILAEIEANKNATEEKIEVNSNANKVTKPKSKYSDGQMSMAEKLGLSLEDNMD